MTGSAALVSGEPGLRANGSKRVGQPVELGHHLACQVIIDNRRVPPDFPVVGGHGEIEEGAAGLLPLSQIAHPLRQPRIGAEPESDPGLRSLAAGEGLTEEPPVFGGTLEWRIPSGRHVACDRRLALVGVLLLAHDPRPSIRYRW